VSVLSSAASCPGRRPGAIAQSDYDWLIDVLNFRRVGLFFAIVGMNPIFIYLFSHRGGKEILARMARPFTHRLFGWADEMVMNMAMIAVVAAMMWFLCYFLYKRKIFIRL
jgi:hypothetical protein